ncbi:MAG TPA: type IV pilus biogenesis/stability protein PilW [Gammaproteobacteria bacterium]|nr:type IV pilus biogenesis/stability protein PilW [Gammaproteobacteria bacterium]
MRIDKFVALVLLLGLLQACVAVDPQQTQNEKASAVNVQLGIGYLQQNKLELASEKLTKAIRQNPDSASAHNAYAILQDRLKQYDLAEYHYKKATELDPKDSQAANNYGAFLCRNDRELEAEKYFLQAIKNPLYKTPEYAYTNAAICLLKINRVEPARAYLRKALASKSDFAAALIAMANILFDEGDYEAAKLYIDRYHLVARASAKSLWLAIRNSLELDSGADISEYAKRLQQEFPDSEEYQAWRKIQ